MLNQLDDVDRTILPPLAEKWIMRQSWRDLLFVHWPVDINTLRPLIPERLQIDAFDGLAWISIIPFRMEGIYPRWIPQIPLSSKFLEINLRTYVLYKGKPGVYFISIDANQLFALTMAHKWYHLPYFYAQMSTKREGFHLIYYSNRKGSRCTPAEFGVEFTPASAIFQPRKGTLEYWLTERYCLYAVDGGNTLYYADISHLPWQLQKADGEIQSNTLTSAYNIRLCGNPPLIHFAGKMEAFICNITKL